ncbi:MAG: hypothetical protein ACE5GX_19365 [Thermoanaerobaculia bacterium]
MREHYLKTELYEKVQKSAELFEWLQDGSLDGIWYWDLENPEHEWLSPRFKRLFGYKHPLVILAGHEEVAEGVDSHVSGSPTGS